MVRRSTRISSQRFPNDDRGYIVKNVLQANSQANTERFSIVCHVLVDVCALRWMDSQETLGGNMCFTVVAGSVI